MSPRLLQAAKAAGWYPGRHVTVHLARAALIGAGQPAWPAALEVLEAWYGLRVALPGGAVVDFDVAARIAEGPVPDDHALIARLDDGTPVTITDDGAVHVAGRAFESVEDVLEALA